MSQFSMKDYNAWKEYWKQQYKMADNQVEMSNSGNWSPGNPYAAHILYADNNQDIAALKEKAIEWEANLQQYQMQLSDQERLSDPHYQLARQRAAGINPDIAGGSGAGGAGASVAPPAMADTELTEMSSPYKTADRIFTGIQSAGSLLTSVSGAMLQGFDLVKNVATFGDMLSMSDSSKRAAQASADVAEATVQPQIDSINQLAAGGKLELFAKIAESLPDVEGGHTVESISKYLGDLGIDSGYADGVYSYTQSPSQQQLRSSQRVAAAKARAQEAEATYQHWLFVERFNAAYREVKAMSDAQLAQFDQMVAAWAYNSDAALVEADVINERRSNSLQKEKFTAEQIQTDIDAYKAALTMRQEMIAKLDTMIKDYSRYSTPMARSFLSAAMLFKTQLEALSTEEFYRLNTIGMQINQMEFAGNVATTPEVGYIAIPGWQPRNQHLLNAYQLAFTPNFADDPQPTMKILDKIFDGLKAVATKTPQGKVAGVASKILVK